MRETLVLIAALASGCGSNATLGTEHAGQYHFGPVEWTGSFWNACAPYPSSIQTVTGDLLAGLSNEVASSGNDCDACVEITTGRGHTLIARAITYGVANAPDDIDLSGAAFNQITEGEFPRSMTWHFAACPGAGPLYFQFQTGANANWTSFWVRNPRLPVDHVEVKSQSHGSFFRLRRETDGTLNDDSGFGAGAFTLRVVAVNGSSLDQTFPGFVGGDLLTGTANLP